MCPYGIPTPPSPTSALDAPGPQGPGPGLLLPAIHPGPANHPWEKDNLPFGGPSQDVTLSRRRDYLNTGDDGGDVQAFRVRVSSNTDHLDCVIRRTRTVTNSSVLQCPVTNNNNNYYGVKPCNCDGFANNPAATAHTTADTTPHATHGTRGRAGGKEAMNPAPDKRGSTSSKSSTGSGSGFVAEASGLHVTQATTLRHRSGRSPCRRDSAPVDGWDGKKGELLPTAERQ